MKIVVAEDVGFCFGVKKAVEHVKKLLLKGEKVYTDGDIVHNMLVMQELEKLGLKKINNIPEDSKDSIFVVRAHGLPPDKIDQYKKHFKKIEDLTCPIVKTLFKKTKNASKKGKVIVFGKKDHPEMKALSGYVPNALITLSPISLKEKMIYFMAQTTASLDYFKKFVAEEIKISDFVKVEILNTICDVTLKREKIAKKMAKICDVVFVVGGKHSSNTRKLFQIVISSKGNAIWIEKPEDIETIPEVDCMGVISGTSTPLYIVQDVVKKLKVLGGKEDE